jgi:alpha-mannosidase
MKASTETGGHRWVDLSEGDYGVGLLNDGPYCCDVQRNRLRLTLFPEDFIDDPDHDVRRFTYSLLPHGGDLREGEVVENSYAIAISPDCIPIVGNRAGKLPLERSFFEVDTASIFISCIKRAEEQENAIVVRMYEAHNTRGIVLLSTTLPVKQAWLCDLLENDLAEIPLDNGEAMLPFHPFEIITVKYTT